MMGIGQALTEGTVLRRRRPPAQRGAAGVQAADVRRRAGDPHPLRADRHARRRPTRCEGSGRGTERGDRGGDLQRARKLLGRPVRQLPMTAERVWETMSERSGELHHRHHARRGARGSRRRARVRSPAAATWSSARARARRRCRTRSSPSIGIDDARRTIERASAATACAIGALVSPRPPRGRARCIVERYTRARRRQRARRVAVDAQRRHARRQRDERVPAMDTGAPLVVLGAEVELQSRDGVAPRRRSQTCGPGPGRTVAAAGRALRGDPPPGARARLGQRVRAARVPAGDGDRRRRRRRVASSSTEDGTLARVPDRAHRRRPDDHRASTAPSRLIGRQVDDAAGARRGRRAGQRAGARRSATCAPAIVSTPLRRRDGPPRGRRRRAPRRRRVHRRPCQPQPRHRSRS